MTNAELAILSLVAEEPRHGYEIEQVIEARGMRSWTEVGHSSIYYLLKKLEDAGLVEAQLAEATRGAARKVYRATDAGRDALHDALIEALATPAHCDMPIQLGLSNLPVLEPAEVIAALQRYQEALDQRLLTLYATWERQKPLPYFVEAQFELSATLIEAERDWVAGFVERLDARC